MKRDVFTFLCGMAAAASFGHIGYAVATARGAISVPIWRGREWGVGKMLIEAVIYGAISVVLGYLGWRSEPRELLQPTNSQEDGREEA